MRLSEMFRKCEYHTAAELRGALILAGRRIVKLNFGRRDDSVLAILRRCCRRLATVPRRCQRAQLTPGESKAHKPI